MDYLEHHGVIGMKWGVRNEETLARYARQAPKTVRKNETEHTYTLAKGSTFQRFDSVNNSKKVLKRSKTYVSQNEDDREVYRKNLTQLPSVSSDYRSRDVVSTQISAIDDVKVMKGEAVFNSLLKEYGGLTIDQLSASADAPFVFSLTKDTLMKGGYSEEEAIEKAYYMPIKTAYAIRPNDNTNIFYRKALAETLLHDPTEGERVINKFKDRNIDAIEDLENQGINSLVDDDVLKEPLVIINPSKFEVDSTVVVPKKALFKP